MCVIEVLRTKELANTSEFAEQFGRFKMRLRQLDFVFFEFGTRDSDRRVLFTHENFSGMVFDRCNSTVLDKNRNVAWSSDYHRFSAVNEISPSDVSELMKPSANFDLNEFPKEGRPPWEARC